METQDNISKESGMEWQSTNHLLLLYDDFWLHAMETLGYTGL